MNKKPTFDLREKLNSALSLSAPVVKMQEGGTGQIDMLEYLNSPDIRNRFKMMYKKFNPKASEKQLEKYADKEIAKRIEATKTLKQSEEWNPQSKDYLGYYSSYFHNYSLDPKLVGPEKFYTQEHEKYHGMNRGVQTPEERALFYSMGSGEDLGESYKFAKKLKDPREFSFFYEERTSEIAPRIWELRSFANKFNIVPKGRNATREEIKDILNYTPQNPEEAEIFKNKKEELNLFLNAENNEDLLDKVTELWNSFVTADDKDTKNITMAKQGGQITFNLRERLSKIIQEGGNVSTEQQALGYKDNSPYNNLPYQDIYSDRITMQGVSQPLLAQTDNGMNTVMQPGGEYYFPGANVVREIPVISRGGLTRLTGMTPSKFQNSGNVGSGSKYDENDGWIREILSLESIKGKVGQNKQGVPHSSFGYNPETLARLGERAPTNMNQAVAIFKKHYLPKLLKYPLEDRKRIGDLMFNAGEDARLFEIDQYLRSKDPQGKSNLNRNDYAIRDKVVDAFILKKNGINPDDESPENIEKIKKFKQTFTFESQKNAEVERRTKEIDKLYDQYKIEDLPEQERLRLLDQGRTYYYKNIDPKGIDPKTGLNIPNDAWEATWQYRISELFQPEDKRPDYIQKIYKENPDIAAASTQKATTTPQTTGPTVPAQTTTTVIPALTGPAATTQKPQPVSPTGTAQNTTPPVVTTPSVTTPTGPAAPTQVNVNTNQTGPTGEVGMAPSMTEVNPPAQNVMPPTGPTAPAAAATPAQPEYVDIQQRAGDNWRYRFNKSTGIWETKNTKDPNRGWIVLDGSKPSHEKAIAKIEEYYGGQARRFQDALNQKQSGSAGATGTTGPAGNVTTNQPAAVATGATGTTTESQSTSTYDPNYKGSGFFRPDRFYITPDAMDAITPPPSRTSTNTSTNTTQSKNTSTVQQNQNVNTNTPVNTEPIVAPTGQRQEFPQSFFEPQVGVVTPVTAKTVSTINTEPIIAPRGQRGELPNVYFEPQDIGTTESAPVNELIQKARNLRAGKLPYPRLDENGQEIPPQYSAGGKAASGAAKGASIGATLGTIVPGVGNLVGAGIGALVGGIAGGISGSQEDKAKRRAQNAAINAQNAANRGMDTNQLLGLLSRGGAGSLSSLLSGPNFNSPMQVQGMPRMFQEGAQVEAAPEMIYANTETPQAYSSSSEIPSLYSNIPTKPSLLDMKPLPVKGSTSSTGSSDIKEVVLTDPKTGEPKKAYIDATGKLIGYGGVEDSEDNKTAYENSLSGALGDIKSNQDNISKLPSIRRLTPEEYQKYLEEKEFFDLNYPDFKDQFSIEDFISALESKKNPPVESKQQGGPIITNFIDRNNFQRYEIKNANRMNKNKLQDVINLSRGVNPFRLSPAGVYKNGGMIMEGGVSASRAGYSSQPISGASSQGPMGPKKTEVSDYSNNGVRSIMDLPSNEYVPSQNLIPIQAEIGEMIVLPTGDLMPVMARKRHHQMADDEVTDVTPENSYILSAHGQVRINKDEADLIITETGVKPYRLGQAQNHPTEKTLASIMTNRTMRPAEVAKRINNLFPVMSTNNPFEIAANIENKINRKPYLEGLIQLSELDKYRKGLSEPAQSDVQQQQIMQGQGQGSPMLAKQGGRMVSRPGVVKAQNSLNLNPNQSNNPWVWNPVGTGAVPPPSTSGQPIFVLPQTDPNQVQVAQTDPYGISQGVAGRSGPGDGSNWSNLTDQEKATAGISALAPINFGARWLASDAIRGEELKGIRRERDIQNQGFSDIGATMALGTGMEAAMLGAQNPFVRWTDQSDQYIRQMRTQTPQQLIEANYNRAFANIPEYSQFGAAGLAAQDAAYAKALQAGTAYASQAAEADRAAQIAQMEKLQAIQNQNIAGRLSAQRATDAAINKVLSGYGNLANRYAQGRINLRGQQMGADIGLSRAEQASKTGLYGNRLNAFTTLTGDLGAGADVLMKLLGVV